MSDNTTEEYTDPSEPITLNLEEQEVNEASIDQDTAQEKDPLEGLPFKDMDFIEHMLAIVGDKINASRKEKFADISLTFEQADFLFAGLKLALERTNLYNSLYSNVVGRDSVLVSNLEQLDQQINNLIPLLNDIKGNVSVNKNLSQFFLREDKPNEKNPS